MTMDNVAFDLCLAPRQIHSIENNLPDFFYSSANKLTCIKKYAEKLGLDIDEVLYLKETPIKTTSKATKEEFISEDELVSAELRIKVNREVKKKDSKAAT
jgi:cytoskeletal protein RodZ